MNPRSTEGARAMVVCLLVTTVAVSAGERVHVVQPGDSVSSIARKHYGDFDHVELLLRYNGKADTTIRPGERLAIPVSEVHRVRPGDTWSELAERYLGDPSAYPVIARLNGLSADAPLGVGASITMPAVLEHPLARGETLVGLAEVYYGDGLANDLLARFNGIDDPRTLSTGQTIRVPLIVFRTVEPEAAVVAKAPPQVPTKAPAKTEAPEPKRRFTTELSVATTAFAEGDYARARRQLEAVQDTIEAEGVDDDRAALARLLAFVYVAFDLPEEACRAFGRAPGDDDLDPNLVSPKIRRTLSACDPGDASS